MRSHLAIIACFYIGVILAAPLDVLPPGDVDLGARKLSPRQGKISLPSSGGPGGIIIGPNIVHDRPVKYSANWAGAVQLSHNITEISGTLIVPNISAPIGGGNSTQYGGSAWIGIDGYTCTKAIFQTGIDWTVQNGKPKYHAWYEWYPDYTHNFNLTLKPGDRVEILVMTHNTTGGTAYVMNKSTNVTVSHTFAGKQTLCQTNAEWIIEDYQTTTSTGSGLVPFARFSDVVFQNASYCSGKGQHGVKNSTLLDLRTKAGKVMATCDTEGSNSVKCSYAG